MKLLSQTISVGLFYHFYFCIWSIYGWFLLIKVNNIIWENVPNEKKKNGVLLLWKQQCVLKPKYREEAQILSESWVLLFTAFSLFIDG